MTSENSENELRESDFKLDDYNATEFAQQHFGDMFYRKIRARVTPKYAEVYFPTDAELSINMKVLQLFCSKTGTVMHQIGYINDRIYVTFKFLGERKE